ncbi:hypothetical protein F4820DRAFT_104311 [Hypoxylon rubiginosum]|uniref:Uncharacterized protein n=1 Tax=Hypoxylon rubiginosum TaxID=110542 RepID=A0ACB9ZB22_9PEZI|nr:hypothetical protein F4820DRAFT_104311 [Hypoxylon rubiginosum]
MPEAGQCYREHGRLLYMTLTLTLSSLLMATQLPDPLTAASCSSVPSSAQKSPSDLSCSIIEIDEEYFFVRKAVPEEAPHLSVLHGSCHKTNGRRWSRPVALAVLAFLALFFRQSNSGRPSRFKLALRMCQLGLKRVRICTNLDTVFLRRRTDRHIASFLGDPLKCFAAVKCLSLA